MVFGSGYLGSRLARDAVSKGANVIALTRNPAHADALLEFGVKVYVTDIENKGWHRDLDSFFDYAVLCAGARGGGSAGYWGAFFNPMDSILTWAADGRLGAMIFTSSTSVYAQNAGEVVTEDDAAHGATAGAAILLETERLLNASSSIERRCIFRLGGLYGPGRHRLLDRVRERGWRPLTAKEGGILNIVRVEDVANAVAAGMRGSGNGCETFNIVDDAPTARNEVVTWMGGEIERRGLGREGKGIPVAAPPWRRGRNRKVSNRKAREELGWRPRFPDYRAGYGDLIDSLAEQR